MKKALILGASGLVGSQLLSCLLQDEQYEQVTILVRQEIDLRHAKLNQLVLDDFMNLEDCRALFHVDDIFCCLGTTMKRAKTRERFYQVDYTFPMMAATLAKESDAKRFLLVSAMGASEHSIFYYSRVKGEVEKHIQQLNLPTFLIFRPSLLLGKREELRFGEQLAATLSQPLSFLMPGPLQKYRPIQAKQVAQAMHQMAQTFLPGTHIFENDQISRIGPGLS
jgi:uncharacterized protein YbjT (DUF2867 family)